LIVAAAYLGAIGRIIAARMARTGHARASSGPAIGAMPPKFGHPSGQFCGRDCAGQRRSVSESVSRRIVVQRGDGYRAGCPTGRVARSEHQGRHRPGRSPATGGGTADHHDHGARSGATTSVPAGPGQRERGGDHHRDNQPPRRLTRRTRCAFPPGGG
jgi:hypothetical protein